jgi:hypothetical protein
MKKCERKTLCTSTTNTAQLNAQHNKLHIHENDHRLNVLNGFYKSGFALVLEHKSLEWNESFSLPCGQKALKIFLRIIGAWRLRNKFSN